MYADEVGFAAVLVQEIRFYIPDLVLILRREAVHGDVRSPVSVLRL